MLRAADGQEFGAGGIQANTFAVRPVRRYGVQRVDHGKQACPQRNRRCRQTARIAAAVKTLFVESAFLFPWAIIFDEIGLFGFVSMMIFLGILVVGFIYEWMKGALEWE